MENGFKENKIVFYFPTLVLSRSGYKGVISAQFSKEMKTVAPQTTYRKELILYQEKFLNDNSNILFEVQDVKCDSVRSIDH
jgi:hypothetical protein